MDERSKRSKKILRISNTLYVKENKIRNYNKEKERYREEKERRTKEVYFVGVV